MNLQDVSKTGESAVRPPYGFEDTSVLSKSDTDYREIAVMKPEDIVAPIEVRTTRKIAISSITDILPPDSNESQPAFQQLVGNFLIFQMPLFKEINEKSAAHSHEGYGQQGSRMAYHRKDSITKDFKMVLEDPRHNAFLFVTDQRTGGILGSASLILGGKELPEFSNFYLSKELRREGESDGIGLGKYLLSRMLAFATERGHNDVFLTSRRKGGFEAALHLFSQFGFKEVTQIDELNSLVRPEYQSPRTIAMKVSNL